MVTAPARTPSEPGPVWTAAAVARRLGVAPGTLRSWSRRYGIGPAGHSPGRHRRYTTADVAELDTMRELVGQGMALPAAAAIAHGNPGLNASQPAELVGALVAAGAALDSVGMTVIIGTSVDRHGVVATWDGLCRPALHGLDPAVAADPGCSDAQLLLSWAISSCLRRHAVAPPAPDARPVLLACAATEQHTLGAEALYAALVEHGVPARMLGPAVPGVALLHAAERLRPAAVLVWAQRAATAKPEALRCLAAHTDLVLAAGPGWHRTVLPSGVIRANTLAGVLDLLTQHPLEPS